MLPIRSFVTMVMSILIDAYVLFKSRRKPEVTLDFGSEHWELLPYRHEISWFTPADDVLVRRSVSYFRPKGPAVFHETPGGLS